MKNKIIKFALFVFVAIAGLTACNKDKYKVKYDESAAVRYSFAQSVMTAELVTEHNGKILVGVARTKADAAAAVEVKLTGSAGSLAQFALASTTVSFAAGEYEAFAEVNFTLADLSGSASYAFDVEFVDADLAISYGGNEKTAVSAALKLTWQSIGEGTYKSGLFGGHWYQDYERALENPNMYRAFGYVQGAEGINIIIVVDPVAGTATIPKQSIGRNVFGEEGASYIQANQATFVNGVVTCGPGSAGPPPVFNLFWVNDNPANGYAFFTSTGETFYLPEGSF